MTSKVSPLQKEGKNNQEKHTSKQDSREYIPPVYSTDIQIDNGEKVLKKNRLPMDGYSGKWQRGAS